MTQEQEYKIDRNYKCNICTKEYSSYKSLWNHTNIHHNSNNTNNQHNIINFNCVNCNKKYKYIQSKKYHERNCIKTNKTVEYEIVKMKLEEKRIELETLKLKIKLQSMKKINTKTFKAINKLLMDRSTIININNYNSNYNSNYIIGIGKENILETITSNEKIEIMNSRMNSLDKLIEIVHCGQHNNFKNILITNLKDKFAYKFDDNKGYFITSNKNDTLVDLIDSRMNNIEDICNELSTIINDQTKHSVQRFIEKMSNDDTFLNENIEYLNYKSYKIDHINTLLYNNNDKITKDIALLLKAS